MRRKILIGCVAMALSSVSVSALAARAYTVGGAQIFAGPGEDYPVVAQLGQGVAVNVNGCLSDYSWCDVYLGGNRGWVYAQDLAYPYRNRRVLIPEYGVQLGLPLITFSLGSYWDHYYRNRSFYHDRAQWEQRWHDHDRYRADDRRDYRGNESRRGYDYRGSESRGAYDYRGNESRGGNDNRDRNGRDTRVQEDRYRADQGRQDLSNRAQERSNQQRSERRGTDRGSMPDLPGGDVQGVPPGDHSRYQQ